MNRIAQLDKNFEIETNITEPDLVWFDVKEYPFQIYGVLFDEGEKCFLRVPQKVAERVSEGVAKLNRHTSGGRVRFRTDSSYIAIRAVMGLPVTMAHMPPTGHSGFDLYREFEGKETYFTTFIPSASREDGYSGGTKTYGELTDYTINFPLYDGVKELYIGLKRDAMLEQASSYKCDVPVVFYGSSITQGGCASRPGNSYQGFLSRHLSMDFVNLGFSGNGRGEPEMANYIGAMNMSALVIDYDSNAPTTQHLRDTHYSFYRIVREANPDLPIIVISHPAALHAVFYQMKISEAWGTFEERREVIKNTYERAKADGDEHIYFIDGKDIFRGEDWDACTVDGVHPNDLGFQRFAKYLEKILKSLLEEI